MLTFVLSCAVAAQAQHDVAEQAGAEETLVPPGTGTAISLPGHWTIRRAMWPDASLIYYDQYSWWSLDGGAEQARRLYEYPNKSWSRASAPAWSRDGDSLFAWLDLERQLTVIDVRSGAMRSISALPTHVWDIEGHRHMDPKPVWRAGGVVEEPGSGLLLQLIQEESNEQVAFWQRSSDRFGGHWLAAIDPATGEMSKLGVEPLAGHVLDWDFSPRRMRLFVLDLAQRILERKPNGTLVQELSIPDRRANDIALSPDESMLLVVCSQTDGIIAKTGDTGAGFLLINLDDGTVRDGATEGFKATWAPDGRSVACLAPWRLFIHDVTNGEDRVVARRAPPGGRTTPTYFERPVWSADGRRIVVGLGGRDDHPTLLVDLEAREVLVLPTYVHDALWSVDPRPFPRGFVPSDG